MDKIWKDIKGYEGLYMVSNEGDVKSVKNGILRPSLYKGRYLKLREINSK